MLIPCRLVQHLTDGLVIYPTINYQELKIISSVQGVQRLPIAGNNIQLVLCAGRCIGHVAQAVGARIPVLCNVHDAALELAGKIDTVLRRCFFLKFFLQAQLTAAISGRLAHLLPERKLV